MDEVTVRRLVEEEQQKIGEDEVTKEQAVRNLRSWIENNPNITRCRTDDKFLLGFLRTKKFNIDNAKQLVSNFLECCHSLKKYTTNLDVCEEKIDKILSKSIIYTTPSRDSNGRRVLIVRWGAIDTASMYYVDLGRALITLLFSSMEEADSQVLGYTYVVDFGSIVPAHATFWPPWELLPTARVALKSLPVRHKEIHVINLNAVIKFLFYMVIGVLPKKIKDRISVHDSLEDLHKMIGSDVLPEEYGGSMPSIEMSNLCMEKMRESRDIVLSMSDLRLSKNNQIDDKATKSFWNMNIF